MIEIFIKFTILLILTISLPSFSNDKRSALHKAFYLEITEPPQRFEVNPDVCETLSIEVNFSYCYFDIKTSPDGKYLEFSYENKVIFKKAMRLVLINDRFDSNRLLVDGFKSINLEEEKTRSSHIELINNENLLTESDKLKVELNLLPKVKNTDAFQIIGSNRILLEIKFCEYDTDNKCDLSESLFYYMVN